MKELIHSLICEQLKESNTTEKLDLMANIICHCLEHISEAKIPWRLFVKPKDAEKFGLLLEAKIKTSESNKEQVSAILKQIGFKGIT